MRRAIRTALAIALCALSGAAVAQDGPQVAPIFELGTAAGGTVSSAGLDGRPYAMFFGFTHCPDVCPTTFAELGLALAALGPAAKDFHVHFVTVDPDRDTPDVERAFLSAFDPRIVALTGPTADLAALADDYGVVARKVPLSDGGYTFEHTATIFLVDRDGIVADRVAYMDGSEVMAAKIGRLIGVE